MSVIDGITFPLGIDPVPGDERPMCPARLSIGGGSEPCDLVADHQGWAHASKSLQAIWSGSEVDHHSSEPEPTA